MPEDTETENLTRKKAFTTVNSKHNLESFQTGENDIELTVPFAVRINEKYYKMYKKFNSAQKRLVRHLVEASISGIARGRDSLQFDETQPIIINLNANINNAEAKTSVNIDVSELIEKVNELEKLLLTIQKYTFDARENSYRVPQARMKDLKERIEVLKDLVKVN